MAPTLQVLSDSGEFHKQDLQNFISEHGITSSKTNYQVVSIVGPQSSGKSTLLNHVFGTKFTMMDAMTGRSQTTMGVWLAKSPKVSDITTLVMDLEGNDGRERGEDDTNYERQIALFALAVSDTLIINIWCHDIGREHGSGKPIIKTIMQVNLKLFAPEPNRKKTVILFVIRDKSRTPQAKLEEILLADMERIWSGISKPPQYTEHSLTDFFEVKFAALSHYEEKHEDFLADANLLRRRFSEEDLMVAAEPGRLPAEALPMSFQQIWEVIRSQKDLNLPAHKVMVANVRCGQIKEEQLAAFQQDQAWKGIQSTADQELIPGFGAAVASLLDSCSQGYATEAMYFDASVRQSVQTELDEKLHAEVKPSYDAQLDLLLKAKLAEAEEQLLEAAEQQPSQFAEITKSCISSVLESFVEEYSKEVRVPSAPWTHEKALASLETSLQELVTGITDKYAAEVLDKVEKQYVRLLASSVSALLDSMPAGVWSKLQSLTADTASQASEALERDLTGFELSESKQQELQTRISSSCQERVRSLCAEAALTRLSRMKDRFHDSFALDKDKTPRTWSVKEDIPAIARQARVEAARLLAQLCVLRLDEEVDIAAEEVERAVLSMSNEADESASTTSSTSYRSLNVSFNSRQSAIDMQSVASWPDIPEEHSLLQPSDVRTTWREFLSASNNIVQQAMLTQQANRAAAKKGPPLWAIALILLLGANEILAVLYSPIYLVITIIVLLMGRTMYVEMDVDNEMQKGALPGFISLAGKFRPSLAKVGTKTIEESVNLLQTWLAPAEGGASTPASIEMTAASASTNGSSTRPDGIQLPTKPDGILSPTSPGGILSPADKKEQ